MKRKYVRPMLEIETFHLSERISACDMKEENIPENIREAMSTIGFFSSSCDFTPNGGIDYNNDGGYDICYHTVADSGNVVFGS